MLEERTLFSLDSLLTEGISGSAFVSSAWFEDFSDSATPSHAGPATLSTDGAATSPDTAASSDGSVAAEYDWIVRFNTDSLSGIGSAAGAASLFVDSGMEFEVVRGLGLTGQVLVRTSGASADSVGSWFTANSAVASYEMDVMHRLQATPDDPSFSSLWGLENTAQTGGRVDADIDAAAAWDISTGSSDIVVAVIDTGVDYTHTDLGTNIWTNPGEIAGNRIDDDGNGFVDDVHGYDFVNNDSNPMDDHGHGTHVSGTIAAAGDNAQGVVWVNWSSSIMALKFLSGGGWGYLSDAVRAINYATMMRTDYGVNVRVTNNSWGGGGYSSAMNDAIQASGNAGILFVAAAGNYGTNNDYSPHYPSNYDLPNVLAVAATDSSDKPRLLQQLRRRQRAPGCPRRLGLQYRPGQPIYVVFGHEHGDAPRCRRGRFGLVRQPRRQRC